MATVRVPEDFPTLASPSVKKGDNIPVKKEISEDPVVVPFSGYAGEPEGDTGAGEKDAPPDTDTVTEGVAAGDTLAGDAPDPVEAAAGETAGTAADDGPDRGEEPGEEGVAPEGRAETQRFEESGGGPAEGPKEPEAEKAQTPLPGHPRPVATVAGPVTRFIRVGQGSSTSLPKMVIRRHF